MQVCNFLLYLFAFAIKCKSKMNKQKLKEQGVNTSLQERNIRAGME